MEKKKREEVIEEWKGLIRDCENRPDDVRFDDWCRNAGVSKSNYYYWKRRIREADGEKQLPAVVKTGPETLSSKKDRFVDVEAGGVRIHVTESTPMGLLTKVPRWSPMLKDATCLKNVYIVCGFTDLRKGIDSLAEVIADRTDISPSVPDTLFLFCGRRHDKLKGLVWEKDGYLLLYKRLSDGYFQSGR